MNTLTEDIMKGAETFRQAEQTRKRTTAQLPVFREAYNLHTEVALFSVRNGGKEEVRKGIGG